MSASAPIPVEALELLLRCERYVFYGSGQGADSADPKGFRIPEERRQLMQDLHGFLHPEEHR